MSVPLIGNEADLLGVDVAQVADQVLQALVTVAAVAEVEAPQFRHPLGAVVGDVVEDLLHLGREVVVDQVAEVLLQQVDHGERQERRHQRGALLEHVAAFQNRPDDRRVGRRSPDLAVFQLLDQRRLGVAGRRLGRVARRGELQDVDRLALGEVGQPLLGVVAVGRRVVGAFDVGLQEAVEGDRAAGRAELGLLAVGQRP